MFASPYQFYATENVGSVHSHSANDYTSKNRENSVTNVLYTCILYTVQYMYTVQYRIEIKMNY